MKAISRKRVHRQIIFSFDKNSNIEDWKIVDDVVMGGKSSGSFKKSPDGFGLFEGRISLENNGGFSSIRYEFKRLKVNEEGKIIIKLKGDGKRYQLSIKDNSDNSHSYIAYFETSGNWQEIEIQFKDMYPSFRGRKLDMPNFSTDYIEEIAFLIGNKTPEKFTLLIDKIEVE